MTTIVDEYTFKRLRFRILAVTSDCAQHPTTQIAAPEGWVILGGGAWVQWDEGPCAPPNAYGNLLTAMYPNDIGTTWTVASKDQLTPSPANIIAYAVVAQLSSGEPINRNDYRVFQSTSGVASHPTQQVNLPKGFVLVGGGAKSNYTGEGNLLYASYPVEGAEAWSGASKDHEKPDPASITVWAIGLSEDFLRSNGMEVVRVTQTTTQRANHPDLNLVVPNFHLSGGGARDNWSGEGNLLTACYPEDRQTWNAAGKDHDKPDPSTISVWMLGFR
jgi:hypothetical protein